jgi:hypothetical protein
MPPPMRSLPVVTLGLMVSLVLAGPGNAQLLFAQSSAPMVITTDTAAYCVQLSDQVAAAQEHATQVPPDVPRLAEEGRRLCDKGLIRPGIERLRRAWTLLTVR